MNMIKSSFCAPGEPLINYAWVRRRLCGRSGQALATVVRLFPMSEPKMGPSARKGPSRKGLAVNAASRSERSPAVASATVTRPVLTDLPHLRFKRAPRIINQRFPGYIVTLCPTVVIVLGQGMK